jgi:hypothetical protein
LLTNPSIAPKSFFDLIDHFPHALDVAHIELKGESTHPESFDLVAKLPRLLLAFEIVKGDVCAADGRLKGYCTPDPAGCASDDDAFTRKILQANLGVILSCHRSASREHRLQPTARPASLCAE